MVGGQYRGVQYGGCTVWWLRRVEGVLYGRCAVRGGCTTVGVQMIKLLGNIAEEGWASLYNIAEEGWASLYNIAEEGWAR